MEKSYQLLEAIIIVHINSDTGGELPLSILHHIGKITQHVACCLSLLSLITAAQDTSQNSHLC
jgi:hypothetical protein